MSDRHPVLTFEQALYGGLFLLALSLRLLHLGAHPLNDQEAREALAVLGRLREAGPAVGPAPASTAYFFFTYFAFFVAGASDAAARFGPALAGSLLVLTPILFREHLGRTAALAASALLALSTGLLAASRSADGALFALLGLAVAVGALGRHARSDGRVWLFTAAVALALGLAAGRTFVLGLLALVLTLLILRWTQPERLAGLRTVWDGLWSERRAFGLTLVLSLLVIATVGLTYLSGLGALLDGLAGGVGGFLPAAAGRLPVEVLLFIVANEPLLLTFGVIGAVRAFRSGNLFGQGLSWFALVALALVVLHSGRSLSDVVWVSAPLALLAGWALVDLLAGLGERPEWPLASAQAMVTIALLGFAALNVAALAELAGRSPGGFTALQVTIMGRVVAIPAVAQIGIVVLAVALIFVIAYLLSLGWSARAARLGLVSAWAGVLAALTLGAGWGVTQARPGSPGELWWARTASPEVRLLLDSLGDVSNYAVGEATDVEVTVAASPNGLLAWALRDFPNATFVDRLDPVIQSPVVIAPLSEDHPTLGSVYVGQDFFVSAAWSLDLSASQWVSWLAYRDAPTLAAEPYILWVRQDVAQLRSTGE